MKVVYDVIQVTPYRGNQNKKVFIYHDDEFYDWLWMSSDDLKKNVEMREKEGDKVMIKESHKEDK